MELEDFIDAGGVDLFVHDMAALLGIHYADLRVVAVYTGSTIVEFVVHDSQSSEEEKAQGNSKIKEKFEDLVQNVGIFMGSPVLGAIYANAPIVAKN